MKSVCVYCGSANGAKPLYAEAARAFGRALVEADLALVYGGGKVGLMGVIADTVMAEGGRAIGVIPELLVNKEVGHNGLTELHVVPDMHHRKKMMADLSDAFVAMPGGAGTLETHFKQIISHKVRFASQFCDQLVADGEMVATPDELQVIATNIGVIATYWLSYQFVMNPRKYNEQEAIRAELHQVSVQIVSLMAPYLRGRSRQIFDDLVSGKLPKREFYDYLPPKEGAAPRNE